MRNKMELRDKGVKALIMNRIIDYMTDYGWDKDTARMEVNRWYYNGMNGLTSTPKKAIKAAIKAIRETY